MARPLRIEYPGAWYHVFNRGRRKENIFFSDKDYLLFSDILGECKKLFNLEIHAYSLIPNHYHLIVHTPLGNLSRCMRHLNGVYAQMVNKRYKTEGSLFRGRFKSILIEKENYLLELIRYIHRNPYKAKLEKEIGEHKWTSHSAYIKKIARPEWLKTEDVLLEFSDYEKEAIAQLHSFVKKEVPRDLSILMARIKWPAILGGELFKESMRERLRGKKIKKSEVPQYRETMSGMSAKDAVLTVEKKLGMEGIFEQKKSKKYSLKRRAFAHICRQLLYIPCRDICENLGRISLPALSKQFKIAEKEIEKKEGCYQDYLKMSKMLKLIVKT